MWVPPAAEIGSVRPRPTRSGATAGSPTRWLIGPASSASAAAPRQATARDAQSTVSAISGDTDLARWSAVVNPAVGRIRTSSANAAARAKTPNARGPSFRASTANTRKEKR